MTKLQSTDISSAEKIKHYLKKVRDYNYEIDIIA
jgi:hypothetical protein